MRNILKENMEEGELSRREFIKLMLGGSLTMGISCTLSRSFLDWVVKWSKDFYPGINFQAYWNVKYKIVLSLLQKPEEVEIWKGFGRMVRYLKYIEGGIWLDEYDYSFYPQRIETLPENYIPTASDIVAWARMSFSKFLTFLPFYGHLHKVLGMEGSEKFLETLAKLCKRRGLDLGVRVTLYHSYPDFANFKNPYFNVGNERLKGLLNFIFYLSQFSKKYDNVFIQLDEPNHIRFDRKLFKEVVKSIKDVSKKTRVAVSIERDSVFNFDLGTRIYYKDRDPKRTKDYWEECDMVIVVDYFSPLERSRKTLRKFKREVGDRKLIFWFSTGDFKKDSLLTENFPKLDNYLEADLRYLEKAVDLAYEEADGCLVFDPAGAWLAAGYRNKYDKGVRFKTLARKYAEKTGRLAEYYQLFG